jgi:hypothetical protein
MKSKLKQLLLNKNCKKPNATEVQMWHFYNHPLEPKAVKAV